MTRVYFKKIDSYSNTSEINAASVEMLKKIQEAENMELGKFIPLKVHFGEKGNTTFIEPKNFEGIINYLRDRNIETAYAETNTLYKGEREVKEEHIKIALEHGFTQIPIMIADGDIGVDHEIVKINKKHFDTCMIATGLAKEKQVIVLSHFKGHILAGFGGAIKMLGMGFADKSGKLAQHSQSVLKIKSKKCKACELCVKNCPANAIIMEKKARIDKNKCIGCASCMGYCAHDAIGNSWFASFTKSFLERLAEYAYGAAHGKDHIYINFALNITRFCDCQPGSRKPITKDVGIFASTDPVAIDQACIDLINKSAKSKCLEEGIMS